MAPFGAARRKSAVPRTSLDGGGCRERARARGQGLRPGRGLTGDPPGGLPRRPHPSARRPECSRIVISAAPDTRSVIDPPAAIAAAALSAVPGSRSGGRRALGFGRPALVTVLLLAQLERTVLSCAGPRDCKSSPAPGRSSDRSASIEICELLGHCVKNWVGNHWAAGGECERHRGPAAAGPASLRDSPRQQSTLRDNGGIAG